MTELVRATDSIEFNDVDLTDTHSESFAASLSNTTSLGTFSLDAVSESASTEPGSVAWHYNLTNSAAQYLRGDEAVNESYPPKITDEAGATATQSVTITIQGTNDGVTITSGAQA